MAPTTTTHPRFESFVPALAPTFASRAEEFDRESRFVAENFELLRGQRAMSCMIPIEFGGGGATHRELCDLVREMAHACPSTALAFSMHAHLVAATVWRVRQGKSGDTLLRRIAAEQIVLLSTGGSDWVDSNGTMTRVDGGYRVSARKVFGSGAPVADLAVTSARYLHPAKGWQVLHFPLSMRAEGVRVENDWNALGMRGTGSHTVVFEDVFVAEDSVTLARPAGVWAPVWSMIVVVAFPVFMAPYVGVAERSRDLAIEAVRRKGGGEPAPEAIALVGELENALATARMAWRDMVERANDYDFAVDARNASATLSSKTLLARACVDTVRKAMEVAGGRAYRRDAEFERLLRDVLAITYHPLSEKRQEQFAGRVALGLEPVPLPTDARRVGPDR